ncbi:MAG TPA: hypothetical protein VMZ06_02840 [Candidatus Bathyarchaeia archaeon]|nr:hypothetical protein [Candidatus Bathyarchaeia archaeon]
MKRLLKVAKYLLLIWGGLTLACVVVLAALTAYRMNVGGFLRDKTDQATADDVRFVLNWCELGVWRIESVVHSHVSPRSLTGDYTDAYAIKISQVTPEELLLAGGTFSTHYWYRGDQLPKMIDDAIPLVVGSVKCDNLYWFPPETELRSSEIYVYPWTIGYHGIEVRSAELIFTRPADKMVFFFGGKI